MENKEIILQVRWIGLSTILTNKKGDTFEIPGSSRYEELQDFVIRALADNTQEHSASNIQAVSRCEGNERRRLLLDYTKWLQHENLGEYIISLVDRYDKQIKQ
jgi:hypothetical protein